VGRTEQATAPATRKRGEALRQAVFDAVLEQLNSVGYAALSMKKIADAAHTGTAALYRRWPDRETLVGDALRSGLPDPAAVPPQDTMREDLILLLGCLQQTFRMARGSTFQVVVRQSESGSTDVRTIIDEQVMRPCTDMILEALRRGVERGEVRAELANGMVAESASNMLVGHCLSHGTPPSDQYVRSVVDDVLLPMLRPR